MNVFELPPALFERARPLLSDPPADWAYIDAGLTGINPARIFVDDPERPTAALMTRTYEYFVGGVPGTAVSEFIRDAPVEVDVWDHFYGFVAVVPSWNDHLRSLQPNLETIGRRSFRFDPDRIESVRGSAQRVPDGLRLVPLTAGLAERTYGEMPGMVGWFWGGYDRYEQHGFGAVVLDGEKPVSVTYSVAVGGGEVNLGVMTAPDYRRRGLATLCSQACIEMAHNQGLIATWDCDTANVASGELATRIGFTEHEPFVELAFPHRAKPDQSRGLWTATPLDAGLVAWIRG